MHLHECYPHIPIFLCTTYLVGGSYAMFELVLLLYPLAASGNRPLRCDDNNESFPILQINIHINLFQKIRFTTILMRREPTTYQILSNLININGIQEFKEVVDTMIEVRGGRFLVWDENPCCWKARHYRFQQTAAQGRHRLSKPQVVQKSHGESVDHYTIHDDRATTAMSIAFEKLGGLDLKTR